MSVDILQAFSFPPIKRTQKTGSLLHRDTIKCAEVFVTSNADKWIFICAFCQKDCCDIGAFICHIKLEHLSNQLKIPELTSQLNVSPPQELSRRKTTPNNINPKKEELSPLSNISKIVDISSFIQTNSIVGENFQSNKSKDETIKTDSISLDGKNDNYELNDMDEDDDMDDGSDIEFLNEDPGATSSSATKLSDRTADESYKCKYCQRVFFKKRGLSMHIATTHLSITDHTRLPFKCSHCNKGFKSRSGCSSHEKVHNKQKYEYKCPLCPVTGYREADFLSHVLIHESDTCFPCQVCAKIFTTQEERMAHWEGHAKEKPFKCELCYRRFRKEYYFRSHLKSHNQYHCNFCPVKFNTSHTLQRPYVCPNCEKNADIMEEVEHRRSMAHKKHVFESDEEGEILFVNSRF